MPGDAVCRSASAIKAAIPLPCLVAAVEAGGAMQPETLQRRRRETGRVALVADDDDLDVIAGRLWNAVGAGGVETPLEHIGVDDHGAEQLAVGTALLDGPRVDDERAACQRSVELGRAGAMG